MEEVWKDTSCLVEFFFLNRFHFDFDWLDYSLPIWNVAVVLFCGFRFNRNDELAEALERRRAEEEAGRRAQAAQAEAVERRARLLEEALAAETAALDAERQRAQLLADQLLLAEERRAKGSENSVHPGHNNWPEKKQNKIGSFSIRVETTNGVRPLALCVLQKSVGTK